MIFPIDYPTDHLSQSDHVEEKKNFHSTVYRPKLDLKFATYDQLRNIYEPIMAKSFSPFLLNGNIVFFSQVSIDD